MSLFDVIFIVSEIILKLPDIKKNKMFLNVDGVYEVI